MSVYLYYYYERVLLSFDIHPESKVAYELFQKVIYVCVKFQHDLLSRSCVIE